MKTTKKDLQAVLTQIDIHIMGLRKERETKHTRYRASAKKWMEIQNNLVEDFNNLVDLEKENSRLETQVESFANEFGYNVNEII